MTSLQQTTLVVLRTLVGWHFLYEGYTKLLYPAWGQDGVPLPQWSSAAYLQTATGPLASVSLGRDASWIGSLDFAWRLRWSRSASVSCSACYAARMQWRARAARHVLPLGDSHGRPEPKAEGTYLLVNKNLIEASAVVVLVAFRTGSSRGGSCGAPGLEARTASRRSRYESDTRTDGPGPSQLPQGARRNPGACGPWRRGSAQGPVPGGPVRVGFIGVGAQGRVLLGNVDPAYADVRAICDINPEQLQARRRGARQERVPPARHYADWHEMLEKENLEAVVMAPPLWAHADLAVGCLEAGKHVLCEKMMAWDVAGCERMRAAARTGRVLAIGYQRTTTRCIRPRTTESSGPARSGRFTTCVWPGIETETGAARVRRRRRTTIRRSGDTPRSIICTTGGCTGSTRRD